MSPMLELRNVNAGYGGFQALSDVNLQVRAGEAVAVLGPNGAGKTTLLRVISRLIASVQGELLIDGRRYDNLPAWEVIGLGIAQVPEGRRLFPRLSVEDNLRIGAYLPAARTLVASRLDFVYALFPRLRERRLQAAGTMSGGEQQMCAIGRALMSGPRLLLLDEPSAGLAPVIVQSIFGLIGRIRSEGYTVLIVEQNVRQVLGVVDRAYLMETGRMRASGTAAEMAGNDAVRKAYLGI